MSGYPIQNPTVKLLLGIKLTGNVIPQSWYKKITFDNGKADLVAINILADFVYWFRPVHTRSEETGQDLPIKQKFSGDKLYKKYSALADQFGVSERQAREACHRLKELGLITIELRNTQISENSWSTNMTFFDINWDAIKTLSNDPENNPNNPVYGFHTTSQRDIISRSNATLSHVEKGDNLTLGSDTISRSNVTPSHVLTGDTSSQVVDCVHARARVRETTTKITTENKKEEKEELSSANAMSAKETLQPSQAQVAGNMEVRPAQEREVSSATPTEQSDSGVPRKKAAAPANKEEKPKREPDEFYEIFKDTYNDEYNPATYVSKQGDFVQLANLRKAQGQALTYRDWCIAVKHYFRTPLANHTLADLAVRYATFRRHALDKFGKPAEPPKPKQIDWNWGN